ncbi:MAG: HipA domain-containing protein [Candidatus Electrothrix scaldis]|nr:MAG: HipA domain-containing protein [Candidatus Electrothrix sp. GW3-3]
MTTRKLTVFIYLPEKTSAVPCGIFTHDSSLSLGSFAYGRRYLERDNCLPADPTALPLEIPPREVVINGGLYGSFRDASPDWWGRMVIAAESGTAPEAFSEIDFLQAADATRVGNLDFRLTPDDPEPELKPPSFNRLTDILSASEQLEAGSPTATHLLQLLRQGTSMGGARPKCTVEWRDALWIAKFPAKGDSLDIPRLEYAAMTLAGKCGINVPEMHLVRIGDKNVFLIRRFDREKAENGWYRKGFQSGLSLMQWDERDRPSWSYSAIAGRLRRFMNSDYIHEFYRRMVFNILVRNTDDHPRNHGILIHGKEIMLSPAYDIVPSLIPVGTGTDFRLAMSVGDQGREADLDNALSQAPLFGLAQERASAMIDELVKNVGSWQSHFEKCGVPGNEIDILRPSFRKTERTRRKKQC